MLYLHTIKEIVHHFYVVFLFIEIQHDTVVLSAGNWYSGEPPIGHVMFWAATKKACTFALYERP